MEIRWRKPVINNEKLGVHNLLLSYRDSDKTNSLEKDYNS